MLAFLICVVLTTAGLGFVAGCVFAAGVAYENGWDARGRYERGNQPRPGHRVVTR